MKRQTFFILPCGAARTLTEYGWTFESSVLLPQRVAEKIIEYMGAALAEEYLGIQQFQCTHGQIDVILNSQGLVTEIAVRTTDVNFSESAHDFLQGESVDIIAGGTAEGQCRHSDPN